MSGATTFPLVEVQGTPYECGYQYGQAVGELIRNNIKVYLRIFQFHADLDRDAALQKAERYLPEIERYDANLLQEMRGIADGAGITLNEVAMLNTRTELMSAVALHECTAIAALPPATSGDVWLAQNWDWMPVTYDSIITLKIKQPGKPAITMLVEAGQIGKMGMNDAGIGFCLNWLSADYQRIGVPVLAICRGILNSTHIDEAIGTVYGCQRASSANFLIAYKDAFAINLETTPDDLDFLEPVNGLLIHTNHFITPRLRATDQGLKDKGGSSLVRKQRAQYLLESETDVDRQKILRALNDVVLGPLSPYLSPKSDNNELDQWATLASIVMNLSNGEIHIIDRNK
jgi:predicted choloylglycine hydrolase